MANVDIRAPLHVEAITGVILAGRRGSRMGRSRPGAAKLQWRVVRLAEALARENAHFAVVAAPEEEGLRGRCQFFLSLAGC